MTKEEKKKYDKKYSELNRVKRKLTAKEWRANNEDRVKEYGKSDVRKKYYTENKKSINKQVSNKRKGDPEWNAYRRSNYRKRMENDLLFKLKQNIKSLINGSFKNRGLRKTNKTIAILGCSFEEYKEHIEKQFEVWMDWNNYGSYNVGGKRTWQIDHIIPISSAKTREELITLNHYSNLRPLCSKENLDKSNTII